MSSRIQSAKYSEHEFVVCCTSFAMQSNLWIDLTSCFGEAIYLQTILRYLYIVPTFGRLWFPMPRGFGFIKAVKSKNDFVRSFFSGRELGICTDI